MWLSPTTRPPLPTRDAAGEAPEHGVVLEQVRERPSIHQVVDRDDLDVGAVLVRGAQERSGRRGQIR